MSLISDLPQKPNIFQCHGIVILKCYSPALSAFSEGILKKVISQITINTDRMCENVMDWTDQANSCFYTLVQDCLPNTKKIIEQICTLATYY